MFGDDPGEAPTGAVPERVDPETEHYTDQLRMVYSEHDGSEYPDVEAVVRHADHGQDFAMHRKRDVDAVSFDRHFRSILDPRRLEAFRDNVRAAVHDDYSAAAGLARVRAVMKTAGLSSPGGIFERHGRARCLRPRPLFAMMKK